MPDDMSTADKLRGLMEGANLNAPWRVCHPTEYPWTLDGPYKGEDTQTVVAGGYGILSVPVQIADNNPANMRLAVASVNLLPALAAVVEAGKGLSDKAGPGVTGCSVNAAVAVDHALAKFRDALSALDAAVAREVG